jgi:hypothetical protein
MTKELSNNEYLAIIDELNNTYDLNIFPLNSDYSILTELNIDWERVEELLKIYSIES